MDYLSGLTFEVALIFLVSSFVIWTNYATGFLFRYKSSFLAITPQEEHEESTFLAPDPHRLKFVTFFSFSPPHSKVKERRCH